jgi:lipopolysaccharide export system ATP-binding protein
MRLAVSEITKSYKDKIVLKGITFEMNKGQTVGILGPNGAGKTTLFYIIAGLLKCDAGKITLSDSEINHKSISERTSLGLAYLPQESSIFKGLTVKENILSALQQNRQISKSELNSELNLLLEEFKLLEFSETLGIKLSGGERRRTEIARALALNPQFILLDEPFAGIDPIAVSDLKQTINQLNRKDIGVLISDHNVRDTMNICSKVLVVNQGKIIADGEPSKIAQDSLVKEVYLGQDFQTN